MLTGLLLSTPITFFEPPTPSPLTLNPTYPRYPSKENHHTTPDITGDNEPGGSVGERERRNSAPGSLISPIANSDVLKKFDKHSTVNTEIENCNSLRYKEEKIRKSWKNKCVVM